MSRPRTCMLPCAFSIEAEPSVIFNSSAVRSPINKLYVLRTCCTIDSFNSSPPTRIERLFTIPPSEIVATSVVPPPISTIMLPVGSVTGSPAPTAAANGSSTTYASLAPAYFVASKTALFSTSVMPLGTQIMTTGLKNERPTID